MNLSHKKQLRKLLISIILVVLIWNIYIGIIFTANPRLICKTTVNEDIIWEINKYEPTETDPGAIDINFFIKYEVWINSPLPFIHSFDGCHLKPYAEAILTNEILYDIDGCYLTIVPAVYIPGITYNSGYVYFQVNYTERSGLPEGLYTFRVDFGDLYGRAGIIESRKTYMNVSEDGISVYSDDVDYTGWFWETFMTYMFILTGSIFIVYIGLLVKDKIITIKNGEI